ncbi:fatty-acid--CoA ligase [Mycolicibacillus koreensis]|nr:fatty-acid--CoA ligase [Mycolicibacillus koreensis]
MTELLRKQADRHRDKLAFSFSYHGDDENRSQISYSELDTRARSIAATLQTRGAAGERVLVLCRPGLDCIAAYFGCVYTGAVAVPVHERLLPRLTSVVPDAQARFALASPQTPDPVRIAVDSLVDGPPLHWASTADGDPDAWTVPDIDPEAPAMIQYTSGSTTAPRGVMLSHHNLLHNLAAIRPIWDGDEDSIGVYWLPPHHDMGLIGGVLSMIYAGSTTVLMSPTAFIKRPMSWLEAISRHRATVTVAPNFAFDRCVEHSTAGERAALDLSSLATVMNGAEPVRPETLRAFADAFAPAGFRPESFLPVYGLAEATLLVSGRSESHTPSIEHLDRTALGEHRVIEAQPDDPDPIALVGCGQPRGQRIVIADPETRRPCGPDEVGEIWITGANVAQGYWENPVETQETFAARLAETDEGPFLRTGDLGFLRSGELFITGRCKDIVVMSGRNHYPHHIEATIQDSHRAFLRGRGAVFTAPPRPDAAERLVVVQEVDRPRITEAELAELLSALQVAISERHELQAQGVVLVAPLQIPTTSSGKIQRSKCRQQFIDGELDSVAQWHAASPRSNAAATNPANGLTQLVRALQYQAAATR